MFGGLFIFSKSMGDISSDKSVHISSRTASKEALELAEYLKRTAHLCEAG